MSPKQRRLSHPAFYCEEDMYKRSLECRRSVAESNLRDILVIRHLKFGWRGRLLIKGLLRIELMSSWHLESNHRSPLLEF